MKLSANADMSELLRSVPSATFKATELLKEQRQKQGYPTFPLIQDIPTQAIMDAQIELIEYTNSVQRFSSQLQKLNPAPANLRIHHFGG